MKCSILVVEDHIVIREALCMLLEREADFNVIGICGEGIEAISLAQRIRPDIILMDINLPGMNGIEAARQIKTCLPSIKIISLSVHTSSALVAQMIKAGASGYLPKTCSSQELVLGIKTVMNNKIYISPKVIDSVIEYMQEDKTKPKKQSSITPREHEVLYLIAKGNTTKEIAKRLNVSEKTIESHRYQIMHKLKIHNMVELVKYAIREGIFSLAND